MNLHRAPRRLSAALGLSAFIPLLAFGQAAAPAPGEELVKLEAFSVTGSNIKRLEVEKVLPVTVFDAPSIEIRDAGQPSDLLTALPQVTGLPGNETATLGATARGDNASLSLRGIPSSNTLVLLNGRRLAPHPISQSEAGVPTLSTNVNQLPNRGIERVEVLRGPQGTLFGRNATVGAVSLITAKPKFDELSGNVEAVGGAYNRFGVRGAVNIPVTDNFAIRAAFITDQHDGYIGYQQAPRIPGINPSAFITSGKRYYAANQKSARLSAAWDLGRFHWNVSGEYYKDDGSPILSLLQTPRPGQQFWSALVDTAPQTNRYSGSIRSDATFDFNDHIQAAYIAGWSRVGGNEIGRAHVRTPVTATSRMPSSA